MISFIRVSKKFSSILLKRQKIHIIILLILMVIGGFLEMLSISMILPFMNAVMKPDETMDLWYIKAFCELTQISNARHFLMITATVMGILYVFKNGFLLFQNKIQNRFVYNNMFHFQQQLLHSFLNRPYDFFLTVKSGEILRIVGDDTQKAFNLLSGLLSIVTEVIVSLALVGTLFIISPLITLGIAGLLIISVAILIWIIRPVLIKAGISNQNAYTQMNQWLIQSVQGIKEIKIMRKEQYFEENFKKYGEKWVEVNRSYSVLSQVPRFGIEAASMSFFFFIIAIMIYSGIELSSLIPTLSAVAVAALRLLPAINRISIHLGDISFQEPMLDKIIENLKNEKTTVDNRNNNSEQLKLFLNEIFFENISYRYPTGNDDVLSETFMEIKHGTSVGIVGESGAGKTTCMDILLGLLHPKEGRVLVDKFDIQLDMEGWLKQIGYIPQNIFILDSDVKSNVAFGIQENEIDIDKVWTALEEASLADYVRTLPEGIDTQMGERGLRLSGGQIQRIGIARALYMDPQVLVFDEATSSLDIRTEREIMKSINKLHGKKTMVIIAHRLSTIEDCDIVFKIENKKIVRLDSK